MPYFFCFHFNMNFRVCSHSNCDKSFIAFKNLPRSSKRMVKDAVVWWVCFRISLSHVCVRPNHQLELPGPLTAESPFLPENTVCLTDSWANTRLAYGAASFLKSLKRSKWSLGHVLKGILDLSRKRTQREVMVTSSALWSGGVCSFVPGKPASPSQNVHKHHRASNLKIESFHFLWFLSNMLNSVRSESEKGNNVIRIFQPDF